MASYRTTSTEQLIEQRRREADPDGGRFVDLRIDIEFADETLFSVGGRWDRRLKEYVAEAETASVARIHPGQVRAVEWWRDWMGAHLVRREAPPALTAAELEQFALVADSNPAHVYSALFAGGRRGGKTWVACALVVSYAVAFPGAIIWLVTPTDDDDAHAELVKNVNALLGLDWIESATSAGWELCNGSVLILKGAHATEGLKAGEVHLVLLNEGQRMKKRAFTLARGGIADHSGLVLVCANPPVEAGDQQWVSDFAADAAAGRRAAVYIQFNPLENPHVDRLALLTMQHELDERSYDIEIMGAFRGPKDAVAYNWIRIENELRVGDVRALGRARLLEHPLATLEDVTERFLAEHERPGMNQMLGLDVQRIPYIGGPVYRFFVETGETPTLENVLTWIVGEVVLEGGDEEDYCAHARELGYAPNETIIVCDASGRYQHSRRRAADAPPPEWKGRGSFSIIKRAGYRNIVPPSRTRKSNPEIVDRIRAFTSRIATKSGRRRLFADPELAPKTCAAIREWKTVHGRASRLQDVAHLGDGASYPIVRLFPRVLRSAKPGGVDPVVQTVDRPSEQDAAEPVRIVPPSRGAGPSRSPRRGTRGRGM